MRLFIASLLIITAGSTSTAYAATQQQCEVLAKPMEAKMAVLQKDDGKPTPQFCARTSEVIKLYVDYQAQADKLNCPFAYVSGQKIGGAAERADLIMDMKKAYSEKCR
jgi:hypothetical protein